MRLTLPCSAIYVWETEGITIFCNLCGKEVWRSDDQTSNLYGQMDEHVRKYHAKEFVDAQS
jgi:hypothetical protein